MEIGLSTYLFVKQRLTSHILDKIHEAGIRQIEIFSARQHLDYHDSNHVRDVAEWFADHDVRLHSMHAPLFADFDCGQSGGLAISVAYKEKRLREDSMDEIKRAIEVAERLPFRYLVVHLGLPEDAYEPRLRDAAFTSLEHLKIFAKERGAQILLENTGNELSTPARLVEFVQYTHLDVKVCFDTGHAHMSGGVEPAFETLKPLIASTHLHDNQREKDDHLMPFDGSIPWAAVIQSLHSLDGQIPGLLELRDWGPEKTGMARIHEVILRINDLATPG